MRAPHSSSGSEAAAREGREAARRGARSRARRPRARGAGRAGAGGRRVRRRRGRAGAGARRAGGRRGRAPRRHVDEHEAERRSIVPSRSRRCARRTRSTRYVTTDGRSHRDDDAHDATSTPTTAATRARRRRRSCRRHGPRAVRRRTAPVDGDATRDRRRRDETGNVATRPDASRPRRPRLTPLARRLPGETPAPPSRGRVRRRAVGTAALGWCHGDRPFSGGHRPHGIRRRPRRACRGAGAAVDHRERRGRRGPRRRATRRRAERPQRTAVHDRLRRRRDASREPVGRGIQSEPRRPARARGSCPGTCAAPCSVGGAVAPVLPSPVVPIARRVLREMVGHLVVDARPDKLGPAIATIRESGARLNLNLLGEAVLGEQEALRRLDGIHDAHPPPRRRLRLGQGLGDREPHLDVGVRRGRRQGRRAAAAAVPARAASRSATVHQPRHGGVPRPRPHDRGLHAHPRRPAAAGSRGGHRAAGLPARRAPGAQQLTAWARQRVAAGGARIKVRLVKGANLAMERVDAVMHDWPLATYDTKLDSDANYLRCLDFALQPEHTRGGADRRRRPQPVRHRLRVAAGRRARACATTSSSRCCSAWRRARSQAVAREVGHVLLYVPVVRPDEFDVAISYLVRRLEENASSENFLSAAFELADDPAMFERERDRFLASLDRAADAGAAHRPEPHAGPHRPPPSRGPRAGARSCATAPARRGRRSDPGRARHRPLRGDRRGDTAPRRAVGRRGCALRRRGRSSRPPSSRRASPTTARRVRPASATPPTPTRRCRRTASGRARSWPASRPRPPATRRSPPRASPTSTRSRRSSRACAMPRPAWGALPAAERAAVLQAAARALEARRGELIEVAASETGKVFAEADVEVSEAVDFANYYAATARELDRVSGAVFVPSRLTVVTPPWNFPIAIPAGGVLAALAAGSGVVFKPAPQARRCAAVVAEALWEAGVPARRAGARRHRRGRARPAARLASRRRPRDPHRVVGDRGAVPLVAPRAAAAGRDERQERDDRHALRRPRPRGIRPRQERVRPRRAEVLGGVARDPRRPGRAAPSASRGSWWMPPPRCASGRRATRWPRSDPSSSRRTASSRGR